VVCLLYICDNDALSAFLTARRCASAVYAIVMCLSVCVHHTPVLYQNG